MPVFSKIHVHCQILLPKPLQLGSSGRFFNDPAHSFELVWKKAIFNWRSLNLDSRISREEQKKGYALFFNNKQRFALLILDMDTI